MREFHIFSRFPSEISLMIWEHVLRSNRLIFINVIYNEDGSSSSEQCLQSSDLPRNWLGNTISDEGYELRVITDHRISPLLQATRQSRQAALSFYRVHIPYNHRAHGEKHCFYINPELDILRIKSKGPPELLADFIHDMKAYDPQGVGLLNIAIRGSGSRMLRLPMGKHEVVKSIKPAQLLMLVLWYF